MVILLERLRRRFQARSVHRVARMLVELESLRPATAGRESRRAVPTLTLR